MKPWAQSYPVYLYTAAQGMSKAGYSMHENPERYTQHTVPLRRVIDEIPVNGKSKIISQKGKLGLQKFVQLKMPIFFSDAFPGIVSNLLEETTQEEHEGESDSDDPMYAGMFNYDSDNASSIDLDEGSTLLEAFFQNKISTRRMVRIMFDMMRRSDYYDPAERRMYYKVTTVIVKFFHQGRGKQPGYIIPFTIISDQDGAQTKWSEGITELQDGEAAQTPLVMATDWSYKDGEAGSAVIIQAMTVEEDRCIRFKFDGKQSVARAEAYAILAALHRPTASRDVLIWTDSLNTMNAINDMQQIIKHSPASQTDLFVPP